MRIYLGRALRHFRDILYYVMQKVQSHKMDLQVQVVLIQKEVLDADGHDPHIISAHLDIIPHDDDLLERVTDGVQQALLLLLFALGIPLFPPPFHGRGSAAVRRR